MSVEIKIKAVDEKLIPQYETPGSAGADLKANLPEPLILLAKSACFVPTGVSVEIPPGFEMQIRSRSGLAKKNLTAVLNSPGTIDSDYRGEIGIILFNHSEHPFVINPGDRIAQAVVAPVYRANFIPTITLSSTTRGAGGFGSTGL